MTNDELDRQAQIRRLEREQAQANRISYLEARVQAKNAANKEANRLYKLLTPIFMEFLGQQVLKADGQLLLKVERKLPDLPNTPALQVYRDHSDYMLRYTVRANKNTGNGCAYATTSVDIGSLEHRQNLASIANEHPERTDWTTHEVQQKRHEYKEAKQKADRARAALDDFGEYDPC